MGDRGQGDGVESQGLFHDVNSKIFLLALAENSKGRELESVLERRAYSPFGSCTSPLPAIR